MWRTKRRNVYSLGRMRRRNAWRRFQTRALPVLCIAVVVAWAWPSLVSGPFGGGEGARDTAKPRVLRGGDAWGGATERDRRASIGTLSGRVTHVRDGDTIVVSGIAVRLANLDCPEAGTPAGQRATQAMRDLVRSGPVMCVLEGRQSYDREVGACRLTGGQDLGTTLMSKGVCRRWR